MIWKPYTGLRVRAVYKESMRRSCPRHGQRGWVLGVPRGRGPRNVLVVFDDGAELVVPWLLRRCEPKADGTFTKTHCWEVAR